MLKQLPRISFSGEGSVNFLILFEAFGKVFSIFNELFESSLCSQYGAVVQKIMWLCVTVTGSCSVHHERIHCLFDVGT